MRLLLILLISSSLCCQPKMGSSILSNQPALSEKDYVLVLKMNDDFVNDGLKVGSIKSTDNGFSTNCTYYEVVNSLKKIARDNGANLIKITDRKFPDRQSTCDRIWADIYRVPDYRKHEIEITWRADRRLNWSDFKGKAPEGYHRFTAVTDGMIELESNAVHMFNKAKFFTKAVFNCYSSWVAARGTTSVALLEHEQLHFDMLEVYRRMLQRELNNADYNYLNLETAKADAREYFKLYEKRCAQYDIETNHGRIAEKQQEWNKMIATELGKLKDYENPIQ